MPLLRRLLEHVAANLLTLATLWILLTFVFPGFGRVLAEGWAQQLGVGSSPSPTSSPSPAPSFHTIPPMSLGPSTAAPHMAEPSVDPCETPRLQLGLSAQLLGLVLDNVDRYPDVPDFRAGLQNDARNAMNNLTGHQACFAASEFASWQTGLAYFLDPFDPGWSTAEARQRLGELQPLGPSPSP